MTVRVLIVDDQEPFRAAARMVTELSDGFEVAGEADSGERGAELGRVAEAGSGAHGRQPPQHRRPGGDAADPVRAEPADRPHPVDLRGGRVRAPGCGAGGAAAYIPKAAFGPDRLEAAWSASAGQS